MAMLTELGKFLRKVRIDRGLLLKDMAQGLKISPSLLSSVETGKKECSSELANNLVHYLNFSPDSAEREGLDRAIADTRKEIGIGFANLSSAQQGAALAFARNIEKIEQSDLEALLSALKVKK